ncbi:transcriptional regulator [Undibacterium sp. Ji83W]|uniref:transcriptional regulator n=1 Tax=Undibacterium sp. Ji83W TaxID=3413043 RepID=UPI003BF1B308
MKLRFIFLSILAATSLYALAAESVEKLAAPWDLAGETPKSYQIGLDRSQTISGKGSKFIRYVNGEDQSWGTLMQMIAADQYLNKRVRFQARVKTKDVDGWAGLWMRIDTKSKSEYPFYNSEDKPIKGTTDWQLRSVVLDVPADAKAIAFGVIDDGKGQVWLDDLKLEVVGADVPVDKMKPTKSLPTKPSL